MLPLLNCCNAAGVKSRLRRQPFSSGIRIVLLDIKGGIRNVSRSSSPAVNSRRPASPPRRVAQRNRPQNVLTCRLLPSFLPGRMDRVLSFAAAAIGRPLTVVSCRETSQKSLKDSPPTPLFRRRRRRRLQIRYKSR